MLYIRTILRFFQDCLEALTDDDKTAEHRAHEARLAQKRWLNISPARLRRVALARNAVPKVAYRK